MNVRNLLPGCALLALALLGFYCFPGHTYLYQDTQIYLPMLERLWSPGALERDLIATHPHLAFTVYDETALLLRRATGLDFQRVLAIEQILIRFLGLWGLYLIARALAISRSQALLVAGLCALGATIAGPAVLTFEYEPVPRGFAIPLLMLAIGYEARERSVPAGCAAAAAFLFHPPSVYPYFAVYFMLMLLPREPGLMWRRIAGLTPLMLAIAVMIPLARYQPGETERQDLFGIVDPALEALQRMRAAYNWVSTWWKDWIGVYAVLSAAAFGSLWTLRRRLSEPLRWLWLGMPLVGLCSVPLSLLLLERCKWYLVPQFQPLRAILFVTLFAVTGAACAAVIAAEHKRYSDCFFWLLLVFAVPLQLQISLFGPGRWDMAGTRRLIVALLLAAAGALACKVIAGGGRVASAAAFALPAAAMLIIPATGAVRNYPALEHAELDELAAWARQATDRKALFHFADAGKDLYPGMFRARAVRAVYVDWKGGGQVNYMKSLGEEWWRRWSSTLASGSQPDRLEQYRPLGVDYLVLKASSEQPPGEPVFRNSRYLAYAIPALPARN